VSVQINNLVKNCCSVNDSHWTRTTIKLSFDNLRNLRMISDENAIFNQSKIINFVLSTFFEEHIDESVLYYNYTLQHIYESHMKEPEAVFKTIARLINLARTNKGSRNYKIKENCLETLKFTYNVFNLFSLSNEKAFENAKSYFMSNINWATSTSEEEILFVRSFENQYSLAVIQELLLFIINNNENFNRHKYEFALRNVEVTFSDFVQCIKSREAVNRTGEHIKILIQNRPSLLNANKELEQKLQILLKPFSEVLQHVQSGDYYTDDIIETIHNYLGGGGIVNLDIVRKIIKTYGINYEFSDADLEKIYTNLCYLSVSRISLSERQ